MTACAFKGFYRQMVYLELAALRGGRGGPREEWGEREKSARLWRGGGVRKSVREVVCDGSPRTLGVSAGMPPDTAPVCVVVVWDEGLPEEGESGACAGERRTARAPHGGGGGGWATRTPAHTHGEPARRP